MGDGRWGRWATGVLAFPRPQSLFFPLPASRFPLPSSPSLDRPFDRLALWRKKLRSALRDVQTILEPDAELAVAHDRRLVAEAHAGLDLRRVALDEVGPLVAIETDAVARAVGKPGDFVARAESRVGDHPPRRCVD